MDRFNWTRVPMKWQTSILGTILNGTQLWPTHKSIYHQFNLSYESTVFKAHADQPFASKKMTLSSEKSEHIYYLTTNKPTYKIKPTTTYLNSKWYTLELWFKLIKFLDLMSCSDEIFGHHSYRSLKFYITFKKWS